MADKRTFFETDEIKDCIEKTLYSNSGIISNAITLAGPNCSRHVKNLRRSICSKKECKITIVDSDKDIYHLQKQWLESNEAKKYIGISSCGKKVKVRLGKNVEVVHNAITEIPPERFIDADLMGTLKTQHHVITMLIDQQIEAIGHSKLKKGLIFTFSSRGTKTENVYNYIESLLKTRFKTSITFPNKILLSERKNYYKQRWLKHNCVYYGGRVTHLELHSYTACSKHPMITGLIVYK